MPYGPRTLACLLPQHIREEVKHRFMHRFTCDHVPAWALKQRLDGTYYAPQFASDDEWLANTVVRTRKDGWLDGRFTSCETSGGTWPLGKVLDRPYERTRG